MRIDKKKKKKNRNEDNIRVIIKEVLSEVKSAKEKKRAIRQECPHQKSNGKHTIVPKYDENGNQIKGLYVCKRCGAKVDLRPLKSAENQSILGVAKSARNTVIALSEFLKLSSNVSKKEDALVFRIATKAIRYTDKIYRIYKSLETHKRMLAKDKKRNKRYSDILITAGGSGFNY